MMDQDVQFFAQVVGVLQKQLRPHILVQAGHTGHVLEAAGRETSAPLGLGRFDVGAGRNVGQLGGECDDAVVFLRVGEGQIGEAQIQEEMLQGFQ